jgi:hypothetical protein
VFRTCWLSLKSQEVVDFLHQLDEIFGSKPTPFIRPRTRSSTMQPMPTSSSALIVGAAAAKLITRKMIKTMMIKTMRPSAVVVNIATRRFILRFSCCVVSD